MPEAFNDSLTLVWNQLTNCMDVISKNAMLLLDNIEITLLFAFI